MCENLSQEQFPKSLETFVHNYDAKYNRDSKRSIGNTSLYLIQTFDRDGNMTDEKFGINLITDAGCVQKSDGARMLLCHSTSESSYLKSYPSEYYSNTFEEITASRTNYPVFYNSNTGIISQKVREGYCTYDYNISGITSDMEITGICVCSLSTTPSYDSTYLNKINTVISKVTIYDESGTLSSITKHLNEKMTIYLFRTFCIHEDAIINAYGNNGGKDGLHIVVSPTNFTSELTGGITSSNNLYYNTSFLINNTNDQWGTNNNEHSYLGPYTMSDGAKENSVYDLSDFGLNANKFASKCCSISFDKTITDSRVYFGYLRCYTTGNNSSTLGKFVEVPTPEELSIDYAYTNSSLNGYITNTFGAKMTTSSNAKILPVLDFNMTDSKMYNHLTKDWDIQDTFINAPNAYYRNTETFNSLPKIWINNPDDQSVYASIFVNPRSDIPISGFSITSKGGTLTKVYMSNKYWDNTTWVVVPDISNLDQAVRNMKYIIFIGSDLTINGLQIGRDQTKHEITTSGSSVHTIGGANVPTYSGNDSRCYLKIIASDDYGWILSRDHILFMDGETCTNAYPVYGDANNKTIDPFMIRYKFENASESHVVVAPYGGGIPNNIRIYHVIRDPSDSLTFDDVAIDSSVYNNGTVVGHYTKSENGYIGIANNTANKAVVVDVYNHTTLPVFDNVHFFHVQDFTNYAIYMVPGSLPKQFVVYDLSTQTIYDTFTFDAEFTTPIGIVGCSDYVYIRDYTGSINTMFLYHISSKILERIPNMDCLPIYRTNFSTNTSLWFRYDNLAANFLYHPEGFVCGSMYSHYCNYSYSKACYVHFSKPDTAYTLWKNGSYNMSPNGAQTEDASFNTFSSLISSPSDRQNYINPTAQLIETPDKKHLLLLDGARYYTNTNNPYYNYPDYRSSGYPHIVSDIGYAFDHLDGDALKVPINQCYDHFAYTSPTNNCYGGICYYNGGFVIVNGAGVLTWHPYEYMVPHKITGTTKTFQCYNNPKRFYTGNHFECSHKITNHNDVTPATAVDPTPDENGITWVSGVYWAKSSSSPYRVSRERSMYHMSSHDLITVPLGSSITVNGTWDVANTDVNPNLGWGIRCYTKTNNRYAIYIRDYPSSTSTENKFGSTITLKPSDFSADVQAVGEVYVGINICWGANQSRYGDCVLTPVPTMFTSLSVTITPPA